LKDKTKDKIVTLALLPKAVESGLAIIISIFLILACLIVAIIMICKAIF
jgi:hypothetical protein